MALSVVGGASCAGSLSCCSSSVSASPASAKAHSWRISSSALACKLAGAPANQRMPVAKEMSPCAAIRRQWARACCNFSRSTSTHWPRSRIRPSSPASSASISSGLSGLPSTTTLRVTSSRPYSPTELRLAEPILAATCGRRVRFFHQSGSRTSRPASSSSGTLCRNW